MHSNVDAQFGALEPRFRLPLEALSAIRALHGDAIRMVAHPDDDETVRLVAVMLTNATLALSLMTELVRAQASGNPNKVNRVRRRLDRVLAAAQARAQATCNA